MSKSGLNEGVWRKDQSFDNVRDAVMYDVKVYQWSY